MKQLSLLLFSFLAFAMHSQSYTFEWLSKTRFKEIAYPGKKYVLKQLCQPKADSIAANGKITFHSASVDGIKELVLSYLIKDTILLSTELETVGKENCKQLAEKINSLTDGKEAFIHYGQGKTLYKVYIFRREDLYYVLYYTYSTNLKKAHVLIVPKR